MIWGGRYEGVSGLGTHVHLWWIHVNVWQNQYSIVKLKKKKKKPELEGRFHEKGMWADEGFCARQGQCIGLGQQSQRITWGV